MNGYRCLVGATLALGCVVLVLPDIAGAATQQYAASLTPLLDAAGGTAIGSVGPGTALTITDQSGTVTHVTLQGFTARNAAGVVYTSPSRHIVEVSNFTGAATKGATQTVGGTTYTAVTVDGWVATSALVPDQQTVVQNAFTLYSQRCSQCHTLQPPNIFKANEWPSVIKNHSPNPELTPAEAALITLYLQLKSGT